MSARSTIHGNIFRQRTRTSALIFACLILRPIALADWQVVSRDREASPVAGIEHRHIRLQNTAGASAMIDLAAFSAKSARLQLLDNPSGSENLVNVINRGNFVAGVNGGYFDTEFKPLGLRVIDGTKRSPLIRARLLTGVLCASSRGIEILRLPEFAQKKKCDAAIECGPFLIDAATVVGGLDQSRRARRTFAAVAHGGAAAVGVCSEVSLAELASALAALPDFQIRRALNLDGGSSSAFWFRKKDGGVVSIPEEKAIRDFIAIAPR